MQNLSQPETSSEVKSRPDRDNGTRAVRASRYASSASAGRSIWWSPESAQQSPSVLRCSTKSTVSSSGVTKTAVARATQNGSFRIDRGFEKRGE